ncbi:hypothetical protein PQX77_021622 [Marasmius sp. AFHP31]|nr:hypothetical protein PQX77_021622 [Marasmius sp. AFHP31]
MGESGWAGGVLGSGDVAKRGGEERAPNVVNGTENLGIGFYGVDSSCAMKEGRVKVEMSTASGKSHVFFTHEDFQRRIFSTPYIFIPVTRQSALFHAEDTIDHEYFLNGTVSIDASTNTTNVVNLRISTSLLSIDQARRNDDDDDIPEGDEVEDTRRTTEAK